ncbi:MAG: thioredoxin family protein [Casimicrobiaceae bacterium]|nr:thioredoxin family protein [Casimicrobiaceae bacterium]MCX8099455.1 thioredoxin family protein [Casimicrobiaceae bacterium]MDW8312231.1 thioredoxin family protein [Burkholderiales bacterium]
MNPPCLFLGALAALLSLGTAAAQPVKTPHVEVELVAERTSVAPGQTARIGLSIRHAPKWHTYWKNPGDSGLPTKVTWQLPPGVTVSEFEWPAPERLVTGPIVNFGYEGHILLPASVRIPADAKPGSTIEIKGHAEWLVCKDVCIPEDGPVRLRLPVTAAAGELSPQAPLFAQADRRMPRALPGWGDAGAEVAGRELLIRFSGPPEARLSGFDVFPELEQLTEPAVQTTYRAGNTYFARLKLLDGAKPPAEVAFVVTAPAGLRASGAHEPAAALRLIAPVRTVATLELPREAVPLAAVATKPSTVGETSAAQAARGAPSAPAAGATDTLGLAGALLFAFLGGMILNLMPCVFPVLSLKILSFAQHHGDQAGAAAAMRRHGLYYAAGVVLSFLALAGVLLAIKAAGSAVGWGFQLQEPTVVWTLAAIFFVIGLNLLGAFEVGQLAPSTLLSYTAKHPGVDAFATGVLAVVAASPCTAPFMGAALGFALTQSAGTALAVFAALGAGMALPYVLLAWFPAWLDRLPRPGPWMVTLKQALAFPMFLAVVWLLWVLAQQVGVDSGAVALLGLVGIALGAWLLGSSRPSARWAGLVAALAAFALAWPAGAPALSAQTTTTAPDASARGASDLWQPWSPEAVAAANAAGKPVFVDYTAAWCVSCQANKRLVLSREDVLSAFAAKGVVLMRADWTNRDPRITESLKALGRSGVPVYALHAPGRPVELLPELLTPGLVKEAIARL